MTSLFLLQVPEEQLAAVARGQGSTSREGNEELLKSLNATQQFYSVDLRQRERDGRDIQGGTGDGHFEWIQGRRYSQEGKQQGRTTLGDLNKKIDEEEKEREEVVSWDTWHGIKRRAQAMDRKNQNIPGYFSLRKKGKSVAMEEEEEEEKKEEEEEVEASLDVSDNDEFRKRLLQQRKIKTWAEIDMEFFVDAHVMSSTSSSDSEEENGAFASCFEIFFPCF